MEYRTVSTKLPSNELTMFRSHCEKKGVTPANLIRTLVLREMEITVPHVVAGKNIIRYNRNQDSFVWSIELDTGKKVDILQNVSPMFVENLTEMLRLVLEERAASIHKERKGSVPIPSELVGGRLP
jgi:hypothetical protein